MNSRSALKTSPPALTPEREALAAAIARHGETVARIRAIDVARRNLTEVRIATRQSIERGEAVLRDAKANSVRHLVDTALGDKSDSPMTEKEIKQALDHVREQHQEAIDADAELERQAKEEANREIHSRSRVADCAAKVLASEIDGESVRAQYLKLESALHESECLMQWLSFKDVVAQHWRAPERVQGRDHPVVVEWKAAFAELTVNAAAPLPAIGE